MTDTVSNTLYASRDAIRNQVIDFLQQYMELENVDLTQSSFLSYVIDIITTLTSNLMFYQSNIYKEFFLTQAQLPASIYNLSSFLGYSPSEASYAVADLLMTVNLPFEDPDSEFNIPEGFKFQTADGVSFITYYTTTVVITNNSSVRISADQDGKVYDIPVNVDTTSEDSNFQFILPVRQYEPKTQEFQIDSDLQLFQFTDINVPIDGKVAGITVYVKDPDAAESDTGRLYTEFDSLYLMSSSDYGYVIRQSQEGRRIYFGNGVIGQQPLPGSTVVVEINETQGAAGNVIAGSIINGERIYTQQSGVTTIVDYDVINASPAFNGEDEEDLQDIRSNSIKSLVSLNRLVSEGDYESIDVVVPDAPIAANSIPVLKRSDLKVNEIQLYTTFSYADGIVPTRNAQLTIDPSTDYIPRETVIDIDGTDYVTLFEMTTDLQNDAAYYHYIMREITMIPTLIQSWTHDNQDLYHFHINELAVSADDTTGSATFELSYYSNESDFDNCTCELKLVYDNTTFDMTNNPGSGGGTFTYTFADYMDIPDGLQDIYFTISNPTLPYQQLISQYSAEFTFRQDLKSYMISNTFSDSTSVTIYDIPVVKEEYYDSIDKVIFENQVLQPFLSSATYKDYRMLTDFVNIKLCNTTGLSTNMLKNKVTKDSVIDLGLTAIPSSPAIGDRYIISGNEGGDWENRRDQIAMCTDETSVTWTYIEPVDNDLVYVTNKGYKYIYTEYGWKKPVYDIPLKITLEVFKVNDSAVSETNLIDDIKTTLVDYYSDSFGPKIEIRRSKIIDLVHNMDGVSYCRLIEPASGIFFDFDIDEFDQQELLEYTPEWIYFTADDITVRLYTAG